MKRIMVVVVALMAALASTLEASEKQDISPGQSNWHRYRFFVIATGSVSVRQHVTVLWDNPAAGMLIAIYETSNPSSPRLTAISTGNDRFVSLDVGLLDGTYQVVGAAVSASTHYHLNVTYGSDELLFRQPNGPLGVQSELFTDRLMSEQLAPYLDRLSAAMNK